MLQDALDLKTKMEASDKKKEAAKNRDYKYHRKNFKKLIEDFGSSFFLSEKEPPKKSFGQTLNA